LHIPIQYKFEALILGKHPRIKQIQNKSLGFGLVPKLITIWACLISCFGKVEQRKLWPPADFGSFAFHSPQFRGVAKFRLANVQSTIMVIERMQNGNR